ncbi:hypothetical protein C8J55DRAFT_484694 [Lentinula edodes]|uniref:Uncharacterized protein n=1 Tax=Lentinula lateritia TaxID=40482 RepID=A0A9W9B2X0_9AGAR|nr:hypothetical protein C8J55DRAFT_484694 [Lentinula edodes]
MTRVGEWDPTITRLQPLFTPQELKNQGTSDLNFPELSSFLTVETMGVNDADQVEPQAMNAPIRYPTNLRSDSLQDNSIQPKKESLSIKGACHQISAMLFNCLLTLRDFLSTNLQLPKVLFNVGTISYLLFSVKLLWKLSVMFNSQPHTVGVGFLVPSAALFTLAQLQRYSRDQVPTQKNIKEIVGLFEITSMFSRLTF